MSDFASLQFTSLPAHRVAYRRAGAGPPVVLLHPLALSGGVWGEFARQLSVSFDLIAPDARGHGDSGWDGNPTNATGSDGNECAVSQRDQRYQREDGLGNPASARER